jgi:hypothetical protein
MSENPTVKILNPLLLVANSEELEPPSRADEIVS